MIFALILIPFIAGAIAFFVRSDRPRRGILFLTALIHASLTAKAWYSRPAPVLSGWFVLDDIGLLFLSLISVLFLSSAVYAVGYLSREVHGKKRDFEEGLFFVNEPEPIFTGCLLLFLTTMTLVTVCQHFGLLWVAIEATTLTSAPLIYFHRHHRSLEATWKYLLICSVGIALALLGNFFLAIAAAPEAESSGSLMFTDLVLQGSGLNAPWLRVAFLFMLVGYGTKMGLAPMHTWLPDAHSEAPSIVSALLSGALLNCAFLGVLRMTLVCSSAGQGAFTQDLLLGLGLLSMTVAAVFILRQPDYKRMLAYSSVEHMGILAFGVGLGGGGLFGSLLHAVNHSLTKAMLFLLAGNILAVYKTKTSSDVRGVIKVLPLSGILWLAGFLAISGSPPFGAFLSEFTILKAALDAGRPLVAVVYLVLLILIFVGMANTFLGMAQGVPTVKSDSPTHKEDILLIGPPAMLGALVFMLGLYVPPRLSQLLHAVAQTLGG